MFKSKIFLKFIFVLVLLVISYEISIYTFILPRINENIERLEKAKAKEILSKVTTLANNLSKELKSYKTDTIQQHKKELKKLTSTVYSMVETKYKESNKSKVSDEVIKIINNISYGDNNYFFIFDYDNIMVAHPYLVGKDFSNIRDVKGNLIVPPLVKIAREKGEGFHSYWWKKNKNDDTIYKKLTFAKNFPHWKIVVGTGVYLDDINKEIQKKKKTLIEQLRETVKTTKIEKSGYFYIFDDEANVIIHPDKNIENKNFAKLKNPGQGSYLFYDLVKAYRSGDKVLHYKWDKPNDRGNYIYDKVSWIEYIPSLKWYIGASVYVDEFEDISKGLREKIIFTSVLILIILLLISSYFIRKITKPLIELSNTAKNIANGNYKKRVKVITDDEIGDLAKNFNIMIDNIEYFIDNLDSQVKNKTKELEKKRNKLEDTNIEFQMVLDSIMEGIAIFEDGKCIDLNNVALKIFGYSSKEELLGKPAFDFLDPSYHEKAKYSMMQSKPEPYEAIGLRKDKTTFPLLTTPITIKTTSRTIRLVAVIDLSDIKDKERALKIAKEKAEESTKLKSEFLANMSHEIRTPMNGIIGMSYLVLQSNLDKKQKKYIQHIDNSAKNLLNIINDILDFSKIEAGKLTINKVDFNLNNIVSNIEILKFKAKDKGLDFSIDSTKITKHIFYGDSLRITQVLINLINNSIKFTSYGNIKLTIEELSGDVVRFCVKDTGIGLTKEQQSRVFESFSQADGTTTRKYGGTGLGLAISKQLVELMSGKIWVESEVNVGSSFIFELPLPKGDSLKVNPQNKKDINITTLNGSHILLVEDNEINQEIIKGLLEHTEIEIDIASNGQEALDMFRVNKNKYELILMDLQMPIMDGYETTKLIRELDKKIPIVALTANAMKEDIQVTQAIGMQEHLNKPIEVDKLYLTLLKYISKKVQPKDMVLQKQLDVEVGNFTKLDSKLGLSHLANNKKLYIKILKDFYNNYSNINLEKLDDEEFKIVTHTIKGLSANIGALALCDIASKLSKDRDEKLISLFYEELNKLMAELKNIKDDTNQDTLLKLDKKKRDELFESIKIYAKKRRAKKIKEIVEELKRYELCIEDEKLLNTIEISLDKRDYASIL